MSPDVPRTDGNEPPAVDLANQSLADALRTSFALLRVVMIGLVAYFGFSGLYSVDVGTVVIHLRFGRVLGEPGDQARPPGGPYFALPAPLDRRIVVRTGEEQLVLDSEFWFATDEKSRLAKRSLEELPIPEGGLVPGRDGSLVTGDQTIVHGQWQVNYRVHERDAVQFALTFGEMTDAVRRAIRFAACRGIVHAVAGTTADLYLSAFDRDRTRREVQAALDAMGAPTPGGSRRTGITVTQVLLRQPTPPLKTRSAFVEVSQAESEKAQKIEVAQRERARVLGEAAGGEHEGVLAAIDAYEDARAGGDVAAAAAAEAALDRALAAPGIGGKASQKVSEARTYQTQATESIRAEAESFARLHPRYVAHPRIVRDFLWQETVWEVFAGPVEKFYVPRGAKTIYLEVSRDPQVALRREQEKFSRELEQRKKDRGEK